MPFITVINYLIKKKTLVILKIFVPIDLIKYVIIIAYKKIDKYLKILISK